MRYGHEIRQHFGRRKWPQLILFVCCRQQSIARSRLTGDLLLTPGWSQIASPLLQRTWKRRRCSTVRCWKRRGWSSTLMHDATSCLTTWCLTTGCLSTMCLSTMCLTTRSLTTSCLATRWLTTRWLTTRWLTTRCSTVRCWKRRGWNSTTMYDDSRLPDCLLCVKKRIEGSSILMFGATSLLCYQSSTL